MNLSPEPVDNATPQLGRPELLACIQRHARSRRAEHLGKLVGAVAVEIRVQPPTDRTLRVLPFAQIAAFVDGHLTLAQERQVIDAVLLDNSVLAEVIAAVRAKLETPCDWDAVLAASARELLAPPVAGEHDVSTVATSHAALPEGQWNVPQRDFRSSKRSSIDLKPEDLDLHLEFIPGPNQFWKWWKVVPLLVVLGTLGGTSGWYWTSYPEDRLIQAIKRLLTKPDDEPADPIEALMKRHQSQSLASQEP